MKRYHFLLIGLIIILIGITGCSSSQTNNSKGAEGDELDLPGNMTWSVYDVGSGGYTEMSAIADMLTDEYGTNVRMLPSDSGVSRMIPLREETASVGKLGDEIQFAFEAEEEFADPEWGPQDVRAFWAPLSWYAFSVRDDSAIEEISDLKGKKVPRIAGNPSVNVKTEALLAFGGLT